MYCISLSFDAEDCAGVLMRKRHLSDTMQLLCVIVFPDCELSTRTMERILSPITVGIGPAKINVVAK